MMSSSVLMFHSCMKSHTNWCSVFTVDIGTRHLVMEQHQQDALRLTSASIPLHRRGLMNISDPASQSVSFKNFSSISLAWLAKTWRTRWLTRSITGYSHTTFDLLPTISSTQLRPEAASSFRLHAWKMQFWIRVSSRNALDICSYQ